MLPQSKAGSVSLGLGALALAALPLFISGYYVELGTYAFIAAMLALSLQLLVGCTGLVSLGHAAFYGLAAYTVYLITGEGAGRSIFVTLPAAMAVAAVAAFAVGALSLRTRGFFFLMVTLAFGQMVFFLFHDTKLGGGTDGAFLARPVLSIFDWRVAADPAAAADRGLLRGTDPAVLAMYVGLAILLRSLFGRVLEGIRVNEHRMTALGFNTYRYKLAAFVIAGALAGVAGHMWAMHRGFVNPELIGWHRSAEALLMILLGRPDDPARPHHRGAGLHRSRRSLASHHRAQAAGRRAGHPVRGAGAAQGLERAALAAPVAQTRGQGSTTCRCGRGTSAWLRDGHRPRRCSPRAG